MSVTLRIFTVTRQNAEEQQVTMQPLDDGLSLHETDSLAFARPGDDFGIDPCRTSEDAAFPLPASDFVRACENVLA
jgi:hypothetical protein